jgi:hypothetical protein
MSAPRRTSSCTCIIRFSKIVSVTSVAPSARVATAIICACMSVGNPGYGAVRSVKGASGPRLRTRIASSATSMSAPGLGELAENRIECRCFGASAPLRRLRSRRSPQRRFRLDAIRHDRVGCAVKPRNAFDLDAIGPGAGDPRAHRDETAREIDHLRARAPHCRASSCLRRDTLPSAGSPCPSP